MSFAEFGDRNRIFYDRFGSEPRSILFIHGWLGSSKWWSSQIDFFKDRYTVVCMDLPGHGQSNDCPRYSSTIYLESIKAVLKHARLEKVYIVAHSMSAPFAMETALELACVDGIILVDTLKNLDALMTYSQADEFLFKHYRADFKNAVENLLPQFLFSNETPQTVRNRIQVEFLNVENSKAIELIEPLYRIDVCRIARLLKLPVRAINSDSSPTNESGNHKYFANYEVLYLSQTGHYPMLEIPDQFNRCLEDVLLSLQNLNKRQIGVESK